MFILKFNGAERNHAWIYSILLNVIYVVKALFLNKPINVYLHICVNMHSLTFNHIIKLENYNLLFMLTMHGLKMYYRSVAMGITYVTIASP